MVEKFKESRFYEVKEYDTLQIAGICWLSGSLGFGIGAVAGSIATFIYLLHQLKLSEAENILETYTLEEILDQNDLSEADVLCLLLEHELVELPEPLPLTFDD